MVTCVWREKFTRMRVLRRIPQCADLMANWYSESSISVQLTAINNGKPNGTLMVFKVFQRPFFCDNIISYLCTFAQTHNLVTIMTNQNIYYVEKA